MRSRRIWLVCLAVASLVIVGFTGFDLQQYLAGGGAVGDSFQRVIYKIVTTADLPLVAVWIGSAINVVGCGWMSGSGLGSSVDSTSPEVVEPELA